MINGQWRSSLGQVFGDWSRVIYALSIIASIAAAAWYLEDRGNAKVAREAGALESRLDKLETRLNERIGELAHSVREVNRRLDRLIELELELSARRGR
jgi:hypothetical protein